MIQISSQTVSIFVMCALILLLQWQIRSLRITVELADKQLKEIREAIRRSELRK